MLQRANFSLGQLIGSLNTCDRMVLLAFYIRTVRRFLIAALRQEGYDFTETRFEAWYAGLATLSDDVRGQGLPPKALCTAILNALSNSRDNVLSHAADCIQRAFRGPADLRGDAGTSEATEVISAARGILATLQGLPALQLSDWLSQLYSAIGANTLFAPIEPEISNFAVSAAAPPHLWALELELSHTIPTGNLPSPPIPMPNLIRRDGLCVGSSGTGAGIQAEGVLGACEQALEDFADARTITEKISNITVNRRSTSRVPYLLIFIAAFGPMRSIQIEAITGASRLGVHKMMQSLDLQGAISRYTISGSHLFTFRPCAPPLQSDPSGVDETAFSHASLHEYEASLEALDRLLSGRPRA